MAVLGSNRVLDLNVRVEPPKWVAVRTLVERSSWYSSPGLLPGRDSPEQSVMAGVPCSNDPLRASVENYDGAKSRPARLVSIARMNGLVAFAFSRPSCDVEGSKVETALEMSTLQKGERPDFSGR